MRILATSDLHLGLNATGDRFTRGLARLAAETAADALLIAGDVAGLDKRGFSACLDLFADFPGLKLVVAGNHDIWSLAGDTGRIHARELPRRAALAGFHYLDAEPLIAGPVGFVGSLGWYDYGFRNRALDVPLEAYQNKRLPGVCRWNDGRFVRWAEGDAAVAAQMAQQLAGQIAAVAPHVDVVVAAVHHVPFAELVAYCGDVARDFACAFLGSPRLGEVLAAEPKVRLCVTGHSHREADIQVCHERPGGPIRVVNPGSRYDRKELVSIALTIEDAA